MRLLQSFQMLAFIMMDYHHIEVKMNEGRKLAPFGSFQEIVRICTRLSPFNAKDTLIPVNVSSFFPHLMAHLFYIGFHLLVKVVCTISLDV